jgi:hypothetical protein
MKTPIRMCPEILLPPWIEPSLFPLITGTPKEIPQRTSNLLWSARLN